MSREVDSKVVEMRFDNKAFESNARESIGTLTKLKEALNLPTNTKGLEGIDKVAKNTSLSGLAAGIEALERRFSTMGIVGMRVIQNITDGLMNKVARAVNVVSDALVSGGLKRAMNIENAHFSLQALLKDEQKVQAVMADAMTSVDGTAYGYDQAAKAASMFGASGLQAGEDMLTALKAITGVAAMTNSEYEAISMIFTAVAGQGRVMGDQLMQLSGRGLNAAATIAKYFQEVQGQSKVTEGVVREMVTDGEISFKIFADAMYWAFGESAERANETFTGSFANMKFAFAKIGAGFFSPFIEQNSEMVKLFNALRIKVNDVKSALVFDEQKSAISGLAEATGLTNEELNEMFATVKADGKVGTDVLGKLQSTGVGAADAIAKYMNGVNDGSIRANYAITTLVKDITKGMEVNRDDIKRFAEDGSIDLATFTAAMETEYGNQRLLSRQFTEFALDLVKNITEMVNNADLTKPLELFYYWVEITKNLLKGLGSVLAPVAKAFGEVFLAADPDVLIDLAAAIEEVTSHFRLSEKASQGLHDTMKGLFDVIKLVVDIFFKLIGAILPVSNPFMEVSGNITEGIFGITGGIGRLLSSFTEMVRGSETVSRAYEAFSRVIGTVSGGIVRMVGGFFELARSTYELPIVQENIDKITDAIKRFGVNSIDNITKFLHLVHESAVELRHMVKPAVLEFFDRFTKAVSGVNFSFEGLNFSKPMDLFQKLYEKIKQFIGVFTEANGLSDVSDKLKTFANELQEALKFDAITDKIDHVMEVLGNFSSFIKEKLSPILENFSFGGAVATGGGIGIIYAIVKLSKSLKASVTGPLNSLSGVLSALKETLAAYQQDLKASAILKIAGAITMLAGALVVLSFVDSGKLLAATLALSAVAAVFLGGIALIRKFAEKEGPTVNTALNTFAKGLKQAMNKLASAVQITAIGFAVTSFAASVALIAAAIVGLGVMYSRDAAGIEAGFEMVAKIAAGLVIVIGGMSLLGTLLGNGMKAFAAASVGILALSAALLVTVGALDKLFKMEFPPDWEFRTQVLTALMLGLGALSLALGVASRLAGENSMKASSILAMALSLQVTVAALDKLFQMNLPPDYADKLVILGLVFGGFGALMIELGLASRLAGGKIQAAGTILAMCALVGSITAALMVLQGVPFESLLKGAVSLDLVLVAVGAALFGAGQVQDESAGQAVMNMSVLVGAIAAALGVLSMVDFVGLLKGATALDAVLLAIAYSLKQAGTISDESAAESVSSMVTLVGVIATSLVFLSNQPWPGLLAGAIALSGVLLAMGKVFQDISDIEGEVDMNNIEMFLLATVALLPISLSLYQLSTQPWEGMIASGIALSSVIMAYGTVFKMVSGTSPDLAAIALFAAGTLAVAGIAASLYILSNQPWQGLLAAAASLSAVLLAMSAAMGVCTMAGAAAGPALTGMGLLAAFIAGFTALMVAMGAIFSIPEAQALLNGGIEAMIKVGEGIGGFVGAIVSGVITRVSASLPQLGTDLSAFMTNLMPFIIGSKMIDAGSVASVGFLAAVIVALSVAEIINGVTRLLGIKMVDMAVELSEFMVALTPFVIQSRMLKEDSMKACALLGEMIITLTASQLIAGVSRVLGLAGGSLSKFGEELEAFGPSIKSFADTVKNVKPEAVEGAASAAEIMATMATKLPAQNGLAQKIFGTKSLKSFGQELSFFGPYIASFAELVKDVKPEAVEGAAAAAEIMATLESKLPAQEGLAQKIFGSKSLKAFGEELTSFADSIVPFTIKVRDLDANSIENVKLITEVMTMLANDLPSTESVWQKIFGGGTTTISKFGEQLNDFGDCMVEFTEKTKGVNNFNVNSAVAAIKSIIDLTTNLANTDASGLVKFTEDLGKMGTDSVKNFSLSFQRAYPIARNAVKNLFAEISKSANVQANLLSNQMITNGSNVVNGLINGLSKHRSSLAMVAGTLATTVDTSFKEKMIIESPSKLMEENGEYVVEGLIEGLENGEDKLEDTSKDLAEAIDSGLEESDLVTGETTKQLNSSLFALVSATKVNMEDLANIVDGKMIKIATSTGELTGVIKENLTNGLDLSFVGDEFQTILTEIGTTITAVQEELANGEENFRAFSELSRDARLALNAIYIGDERDYWTELLAIRQAGQDAEKYKDMEMLDFQKEVTEDAKKIYEDYVNQFESTKDQIMGTFDIFTEVKKKETVNKNQLTKILEDQINAYTEYTETIKSLNERLKGTNLLEYLEELGVDSVDQLKVMNEMTDDELSAYAALYDQKLAAANEIAVFQMQDLRQKTEQELSDLFGAMYYSVDLDNFSEVFDGSVESIQKYVTEMIGPLDEFAKKITTVTTSVGEEFAEGVTNGVTGYVNGTGSTITTLLEAEAEAQKENAHSIGTLLGNNIGNGVVSGMSAMEGVDEAANLAIMNISSALKNAGEIHSPSELTKREIGVPLIQGIVEGLRSDTNGLTDAAQNVISVLISNFQAGTATLTEAVSNFVKTVAVTFKTEAQNMQNVGADLMTAMVSGMTASESAAMEAARNLGMTIVQEMKNMLPEEEFAEFGENIVTGLSMGVKKQEASFKNLVSTLCTQIVNDIKKQLATSVFVPVGQNITTGLSSGINSQKQSLLNLVNSICSSIENTFRSTLAESKFSAIGKAILPALGSAMTSHKDEVINAAEEIAKTILKTYRKEMDVEEFKEIGRMSAQGVADGISDKIDEVADAAIRAARAAIKAAKEELDEHSPSRVFHNIGENISQGLADGIIGNIGSILAAGTQSVRVINNATRRAAEGLNSLSDGIDSPTIKPVVDMSKVDEGLKQISNAFERGGFNISPTVNNVGSASRSFMNGVSGQSAKPAQVQPTTTNTYTFTQNNYSPTALSRADIYRQTRNQFATFREAVESA